MRLSREDRFVFGCYGGKRATTLVDAKGRSIEFTPFEAALISNIEAFVKKARAHGTVGMSIENLQQAVPTPSDTLEGAPRGTNAPWAYGQIFSKALKNANLGRFTVANH